MKRVFCWVVSFSALAYATTLPPVPRAAAIGFMVGGNLVSLVWYFYARRRYESPRKVDSVVAPQI